MNLSSGGLKKNYGQHIFFAYQNFFFCISPEKTSAGLENFIFIFDTGSFDTRRFTLEWKMRFFASLDQRHVTNLNPLCFIKILIQKGFQICENPFSGVFYMKIFKKISSKKSILIHLEIHRFLEVVNSNVVTWCVWLVGGGSAPAFLTCFIFSEIFRKVRNGIFES